MRSLKHSPSRKALLKLALVLACVPALTLASAAWRAARAPRVWAAGDVPLAFWAWRQRAPEESEVLRAASATRARVLFLRAGQFDFERGEVRRIRPVEGRLARALELQLVYNGTRSLLTEFERVGESALASSVVEAYLKDSARAARDGARVTGLQLDFDVPTRLLARYASVLREVRARLPRGTLLSVTGLPTWMNSAEIATLLDTVDFWTPQCYGAEIPERLDARVPIASPQSVERTVARARALGKPFYAGLAAYGYALLYSPAGRLVSLRGDLDASHVARSSLFELVERAPFARGSEGSGDAGGDEAAGEAATTESEWRYVYRAREDGVLDGLNVRAGEFLVIDMPSSASLRACARGVRRQAGERLLGICLFRLPGADDASTLGLEQLAAALANAPPRAATDLRARRAAMRDGQDADGARDGHAAHEARDAGATEALPNHVSVNATNRGAAVALFGEDAFVLTLRVPRGSLRGVVRLEGFSSVETLCAVADNASTGDAPVVVAGEAFAVGQASLRPCGLRRADVLRLRSPVWTQGTSLGATLSFDGDAPTSLTADVAVKLDDGRTSRESSVIQIGDGGGR